MDSCWDDTWCAVGLSGWSWRTVSVRHSLGLLLPNLSTLSKAETHYCIQILTKTGFCTQETGLTLTCSPMHCERLECILTCICLQVTTFSLPWVWPGSVAWLTGLTGSSSCKPTPLWMGRARQRLSLSMRRTGSAKWRKSWLWWGNCFSDLTSGQMEKSSEELGMFWRFRNWKSSKHWMLNPPINKGVVKDWNDNLSEKQIYISKSKIHVVMWLWNTYVYWKKC